MKGVNMAILAKFRPQYWEGDYAIFLPKEHEVAFDVTSQIVAMGAELALRISDHSYEADELWHSHPLSSKVDWGGPFEIEVEDSIRSYFGASAVDGAKR